MLHQQKKVVQATKTWLQWKCKAFECNAEIILIDVSWIFMDHFHINHLQIGFRSYAQKPRELKSIWSLPLRLLYFALLV